MTVHGLPNQIRAAVLVALALLAGCTGLGGTRVVTLDERQLAALVEREFPFDRRLLELVDVRVGAPRIRLLPESNRLATELDVAMSDRLFGKGFNGSLALDYALRIDPASQSVRLTDVRVGRLGIAGLDTRYAAAANAIGPMIAEQLLSDLPVYRFRPEDFEDRFGGRMEPGAVTVTSRGVEITLRPAR